jgi:hypothetical protein
MVKVKNIFVLLTLVSQLFGCTALTKEQRVIDRAIEAHGGEAYTRAQISFDFRDIHYTVLKSPTRFEFSREFTDSLGVVVKDVLSNDGFVRSHNGTEVVVTDERKQAFSNSINAVAYFFLLPYGLNDAAAKKTYFGETELEGKPYDIIKVTFSEDGGGEDFQDEFLYWINQANGLMDYMAYSYHTDGGGVRFRKAINSRVIDGIRIQDYENYMPQDKTAPLEDMETMYKNDQLKLLSKILMENIQVDFIE